jgi:hypothetical protein
LEGGFPPGKTSSTGWVSAVPVVLVPASATGE